MPNILLKNIYILRPFTKNSPQFCDPILCCGPVDKRWFMWFFSPQFLLLHLLLILFLGQSTYIYTALKASFMCENHLKPQKEQHRQDKTPLREETKTRPELKGPHLCLDWKIQLGFYAHSLFFFTSSLGFVLAGATGGNTACCWAA